MHKCRWCGFESEDIDDFEEDYINHKGYWCLECDGFTYFKGKEEYQQNQMLLEDSSDKENITVNSRKKFDKRLSPLRYPGGKSKLIPYIAENLNLDKKIFVEPFCGGSSVGLSLLKSGLVNEIVLNDLNYGVYCLFKTICENPGYLIDRIRTYIPSRKSFFEYRKIILNGTDKININEMGFMFLIVNRLAFSGIAKANPKGNLAERFHPERLVSQVKWISSRKDKISIFNKDADEIIEEYYWDSDVTLFIDPPYYKKGKMLYPLYYNEKQHINTAELINELYCSYPGCADILITYDNEDFIKELYPNTKQKVIGRKFSIAN